MIGTLIIPVADTENGKFEYNGELNKEEYEKMVMDDFEAHNDEVQQLADSIEKGTSIDIKYKDEKEVHDKDIEYKLSECEALFLNSRKKDYPEEDLLKNEETGKMFILILNINPNTISGDAESELKYWIMDSDKVLMDDKLTDKMKLKTLSKMDFGIRIREDEYTLQGCKMFENYSNDKFPYYYAFIVEKMIKKS